ncbi:MAG: hypothetical protein Q9226_007103 [Calogaya cf. arnoldii]
MEGNAHSKQQQKAARKAHKKAVRKANSNTTSAATAGPSTPLLIPGTSFPLIIPGTNTRQEQLRQARRWLGNERRTNRFPLPAIREVEGLFHRNDDTRAANSYDAMSSEAKQIVATLESERTQAAGKGDWWDGPSRKGVDNDQQKHFKQAWALDKATKALGMIDFNGPPEQVEEEVMDTAEG